MTRLPPYQVFWASVLVAWLQAPQPAIGFVLSKNGPWVANGVFVKQGESVPAGVRLLLAPGTKFDAAEPYAIHVVLLSNSDLSLRCSRAETCRAGLQMPSSLTVPSSLFARASDVFRLIFQDPERYSGLMSRGISAGGTPHVPDGVVQLQDGRLLLSPFLQDLPPARYLLLFTREMLAPRPPNSYADVITTSYGVRSQIDVGWDRSPNSAQPATTIPPGIYRVYLSRLGDPDFTPSEAWMLVADRTYESDHAAFARAVAATEAWDGSVPPRDVQIFLHACLTDLVSQWQ